MYNPYDNGQQQNYLKKIKSQQNLNINTNPDYSIPTQTYPNLEIKKQPIKILNNSISSNSLNRRILIQPSYNKQNNISNVQFQNLYSEINETTSRKKQIQKTSASTSFKQIQLFEKRFFEDNQDKTSTDQSSLQNIDYINNEYQLSTSNIFVKQKKVSFTSQNMILPSIKRQTFLQKKKVLRNKVIKTPSILKNSSRVLDQSLYTQTQKSYSVQNSFTVNKKNKNKLSNGLYSSNGITKQKYQKTLMKLKKINLSYQVNEKSFKQNSVIQSYSYHANEQDYPQHDQKLKGLRKQSNNTLKYNDQIFPPVYSSIFRFIVTKGTNSKIKQRDKIGKQIEWVRLSQLFKGKKVKIFNNVSEKTTQIKIFKSQIKGKSYYSSDMIVCSFNAIKNNRILLQNIFEDQQDLNPFGIYMVKIYVDNQWKYIIIDDFIPVIKVQNNQSLNISNKYSTQKHLHCPCFLNIDFSYAQNNSNQPIYLWPFLLQKAYASYYSCYDSLNYGNVIDFLSQLTGVSYQVLKLPSINKNSQETEKNEYQAKIDKLTCLIKQKSIVAIGYSDPDLPLVPFHYDNYCKNNNNNMLTYEDPLNNFEPCQITINQIRSLFQKIYFYKTKNYEYSAYCQVYPLKNKEYNKKILIQNEIISQSISLRVFTIQQNTNGFLSIRQKQNRFYMKKQLEYIWIRALLFCKDYDGGYRWVNGKYSNKKSITFKVQLSSGQYYLIVMPQWRKSHNRQISVIFNSDNQVIKFERKILENKQKIIELGCMDLAQKIGKLNQINKSICSYTVVLQYVALIVQNICNERPKGQITIMRSIDGLKARCMIIPVNQEFYEELIIQNQNQTDKNNSLAYVPQQQQITYYKKLKADIEIDIPALDSFTVVLKMIGGIDKRFFKSFNFG